MSNNNNNTFYRNRRNRWKNKSLEINNIIMIICWNRPNYHPPLSPTPCPPAFLPKDTGMSPFPAPHTAFELYK